MKGTGSPRQNKPVMVAVTVGFALLLSSCYSLSKRTRDVVEANCHCKQVESTYDDSTMTLTLSGCNVKDAEAESQMLMDTLASQVPAICKSPRILVFRFVQPGGKTVDILYQQCIRWLNKVRLEF